MLPAAAGVEPHPRIPSPAHSLYAGDELTADEDDAELADAQYMPGCGRLNPRTLQYSFCLTHSTIFV